MGFPDLIQKEGIPEGFKGWDKKVSSIQTVADAFLDVAKNSKNNAIRFGGAPVKLEFPKDFDKWLMRDASARPSSIIKGKHSSMRTAGSPGETVFERSEKLDMLPREMTKFAESEARDVWSRKDVGGKMLAHGLAEAGLLPIAPKEYMDLGVGFRAWDLRDEAGRTVADVAKAHPELGGVYAERIAAWEAEKMAAAIVHPASLASEASQLSKEDLSQWKQKDENGISALQKHMHQLSESGGELSTELSEMATVMPFVIRDPARGRERTVEITKLAHHFPEALSSGFEGWNMRDNNGNTVAHAAARKAGEDGRLVMPSAIEHWEMNDGKGRTVVDVMRDEAPPAARARLEEAYAQARPGQFGSIVHGQISRLQEKPEAFRGEIAQAAPQLSYKDAADALKAGTLPADFNDWGKKNEAGWTLAHAAASIGKLPADFKDWDMEGAKPGVTVAHVAMRQGTLPANFDKWDIQGADGKTIGELAAKHPTMGAEYQARIQASNATQQPRTESRSPEPQAAKPAQETPKLETSSTGRIIGGSRFSRPPDLSIRAPEPERREVKAFINRAGL